jgi:tetratricopeptide (TPR) repeat protein
MINGLRNMRAIGSAGVMRWIMPYTPDGSSVRLNTPECWAEATLYFEQAMRALPEDWEKQALQQQEGERFTVFINDYAVLLQATNRLEEAEPLMRQALEIDQKSFGNDHPKVAIRLNNLALLLQDTNRLEEAEPPMRRVIEILLIFLSKTGHPHPHLNVAIQNYRLLLQEMKYTPEQVEKKMVELGLMKKDHSS